MMDERRDARTHARTDGQTDGRTWATLNALPHSSNGGGIKNVETCLYSNVSTFQRQATFQSGQKMWKRVYKEMFPHLKYGTFQPRKNVETCLYIDVSTF